MFIKLNVLNGIIRGQTNAENTNQKKIKAMIKELCTTLKNRLSDDGGLAFIDVYSGLVQAVKYKDQNADGNPITKVFPVSYDPNL